MKAPPPLFVNRINRIVGQGLIYRGTDFEDQRPALALTAVKFGKNCRLTGLFLAQLGSHNIGPGSAIQGYRISSFAIPPALLEGTNLFRFDLGSL